MIRSVDPIAAPPGGINYCISLNAVPAIGMALMWLEANVVVLVSVEH